MGKTETATASIGIKILLSDLILQINETNLTIIKRMLDDGFIEDRNDEYNNIYTDIIGSREYDNILSKTYLEYKEYLIKELEDKCLFDKELLIPIKEILSTDRWGYNRYGINGVSRTIDFDLTLNTEEYDEIKNFNIVFLIKQYGG